jgi:dolichyl-diphosphooligosaccharide---protein glycosyltransferase
VCLPCAPRFTAIATYLLAKQLKDASAGLLAAAFIGAAPSPWPPVHSRAGALTAVALLLAVAPGYISRSVAGSYDNEGVAIFALQLTFYFWLRAVKTGTAYWGAVAALGYFYMVGAWGGYVFIINLIPLHVLVLLLMGRYSSRLYVAYSSFYVIGTLASMQVPFIGFQPVQTSEHMAALGTLLHNTAGDRAPRKRDQKRKRALSRPHPSCRHSIRAYGAADASSLISLCLCVCVCVCVCAP